METSSHSPDHITVAAADPGDFVVIDPRRSLGALERLEADAGIDASPLLGQVRGRLAQQSVLHEPREVVVDVDAEDVARSVLSLEDPSPVREAPRL